MVFHVSADNLGQARRQDFAAGGFLKLQGGAHFLNTILDECSNRGTKHEMGAGHPWPLRWRRPCLLQN